MAAPTRASTRTRGVKASTTVAKPTANIRQSFGKVTKAHPSSVSGVAKKLQSKEVAGIIQTSAVGESSTTDKQNLKRKRDEKDSNNEQKKETGDIRDTKLLKKSRQSIPTIFEAPKSSRAGGKLPSHFTDTANQDHDNQIEHLRSASLPLPESLETLISLHLSFLKAMSLHFAHNGSSVPANMINLLESMTRIWKRRDVRKVDLRKMFGVRELSADPSKSEEEFVRKDASEVKRNKGAFRMLQSGLGMQCLLVEHVADVERRTGFNEQRLQEDFEKHVQELWQGAQRDPKITKSLSDLNKIPQLNIEIGAQQAVARYEKARSLKESILEPSKKQNSISTSPTKSPGQKQPTSTARKQTLLDRILEKQRLALSNPSPSSADLDLHRAKHRLPELVEILSGIQQQRTRNQNLAISRFPFSFGQLSQMIKDSFRSPIGKDEIWLSLKLLGMEEVGRGWVRIDGLNSSIEGKQSKGDQGIDMEGIIVVLSGRGVSAGEVRQRVEGIQTI
ncbi:putative dna mismatch repair protein msh2 [Phaeomoniella chlamydospora]|uniref:Putative dna mismatch repair protein msh2 n=1 Tax=Phaeomoniella chlamydospora TaxID=158046 RepID=A0A0G2E577_PHACM|nr:putative dna mismatch repair protein msh2 [Phaeomoniella chlamydospora]